MKIYNKKGPVNYKERRLIRALETELDKLIQKDPAFEASFKTANSFEELSRLHNQYCVTDAEIISETKNDTMADTEKTGADSTATRTDPLNDKNPIVRDYVLNDSMAPDAGDKKPQGTTFEEPKNYEEAFRLPDYDIFGADKKKEQPKNDGNNNNSGNNNNNSGNNNNNNKSGNTSGNQQQPKGPGFNPAFDELTQAKKVKQTRRFAKNIVAAVCTGLEMGYVWWITKDINEAKLIEYQMEDSIDLELLVNLEADQETTIRQFFQSMCAHAEAGKAVPLDDQEELADALADVLIEKGIAPTPTQTLFITGLRIVGLKVLEALAISNSINKVLQRGFLMKSREKKASRTSDMQEIIDKLKERTAQREESADEYRQHEPSQPEEEEEESHESPNIGTELSIVKNHETEVIE